MITGGQNATSSNNPHGWRAVWLSVIILICCLGILIILPTIALARLGIPLDLRGRTLAGLGGTLASELILFDFLMRWLKGQGRSLRDIGWNRPTTMPAVFLGIMFGLVYAFYTLGNPLIGPNATEISLFKLAGVVVGVFSAVIEEFVFRGFIISELKAINVSTVTQILISGASFGIIHIGFDFFGVLLTFIMGIVMATIYILGKRSLTPSILSHAIINIIVEPWLLLFIITMYSRLSQLILK